MNIKQQVEKKSAMIDNKEKAFMDLYKFVKSYIPATDKNALKKVEVIVTDKI